MITNRNSRENMQICVQLCICLLYI